MNGILSNNNSENKLHGVLCPKSNNEQSIETAGSLAMGFSLFSESLYDEFSTNNPFSVDYSAYSDCGESVSCGFLSCFSEAISTLNSASGECSASCSSDCGCSGGFTSVC